MRLIKHLVVAPLLALQLFQMIFVPAYADYSACIKNTTQTCLYTDPISGQCTEYSASYTCYDAGGYTSSCANKDMSGYYQVGPNKVNQKYPGGNTSLPPSSYDTYYSTDASCSPAPSGTCGSMYNVQPEGNVTGYSYQKSCYAGSQTSTTTCNPDPKACTSVVSSVCTATQGGVCSQRQITYSCGGTSPQCLGVASTTDPTAASGNNGLANYVARMDLAKQITENASFVNGQLRIFGGSNDNCKFITNGALSTITTIATIVDLVLTVFTAGGYAAAFGAVSAYGLSVLSTMKCCAANPSSINPNNGLCTVNDIQLANARKKNLAFRVDTTGNHEDYGDGNEHDCLNADGGLYPPDTPITTDTRTNCKYADLIKQDLMINQQTWCSFPNMLAKIVQVQGREQLTQLALANAAGAVQQAIAYPYYGATPTAGQWTTPVNVNGNMVSAWEWPKNCSDPSLASSSILAGQCPQPHTDWLAICSSSNCASSPGGTPNSSAPNTGWSFVTMDSTSNLPITLNRFAVAEGLCDSNGTGNCAYTVHAWPAGVGGTLHVNLQLNWPEHFPGATGFNPDFIFTSPLGDNIEVEAYTWDTNDTTSTVSPKIRYTLDGGATWSQSISLPSPQADLNFALPNGPTTPAMTIYGGCQQGQCTYTLSYAVNVQTKPWGYYTWQKHQNCATVIPNPPGVSSSFWTDQQCDSRSGCTTSSTKSGTCIAPITRSFNYVWHPDCTGFTLPQLESLDFSKMDFSAYLASLNLQDPSASTSQSTALTNTTSTSATALQNGASSDTSANAMNLLPSTFTISPSGGVWPGTPVTLKAKNFYPLTSNGTTEELQVTSFSINWGDGQTSSGAVATGTTATSTTSFTHSYGSAGCPTPTSSTCTPTPSVDTTYSVSVTFHTAKGDFTDLGDVLVSTSSSTSSTSSSDANGAQTHGTVVPQS